MLTCIWRFFQPTLGTIKEKYFPLKAINGENKFQGKKTCPVKCLHRIKRFQCSTVYFWILLPEPCLWMALNECRFANKLTLPQVNSPTVNLTRLDRRN